MYQVPHNRTVLRQRIHRQHNQFNHNRQRRPCNVYLHNANLHPKQAAVQSHHHVIQVQFQLHRVANRALAVPHQPVKQISGNIDNNKRNTEIKLLISSLQSRKK